ncbi:hypothetical protein [Xanthomonas sp. WHRI 7945]|nr:hypothetical protein [Xanthomonas campestris pv. campestris]
MKRFFIGTLLCALSIPASAAVCNVEGKAGTLIPSQGVAGLYMTGAISGCSCDYNMIWIDTTADGGKAMYAAVLAAKLNNLQVKATIQDGQGSTSPGYQAITYRYNATCKLMAFELM